MKRYTIVKLDNRQAEWRSDKEFVMFAVIDTVEDLLEKMFENYVEADIYCFERNKCS
jgi:hypothetical protein